MSLLPVFSQVLTLDAEVSDNALNNIRKSTNEILEEMKKIEQGASAGINRFFAFVQEIATSFNELSLEPEINLSVDNQEIIQSSETVENSIQKIVKTALSSTQEFDTFLQNILTGLTSLSLDEPINIEINSGETQEKILSITSSIDALKDAMSVLNYTRNLLSNDVDSDASHLANLNAEYQAMEDQLASLNNELTLLTEAEKKNKENKLVIDEVIKNLGADYDQFISTMQTQGIKAAIEEAQAQRRLSSSVDETGKSYQQTVDKMKDFILNAIGATDIMGTLQKVFSASLERSQEIESLDKLSKKMGIAAIDIDAFSGAMAAIGGTKEAAQADLAAMATAFDDTQDPIEQLLQVADNVKNMSFDDAQKELEKLGVVDDKTIELMMKGRQELERTMGVQKQFSGINDDSIESAIQLNATIHKFSQLAAQFKNNFLDMIIPTLAKGMEWFDKLVDFCVKNKDIVISFFSAIGAAVAIYYLPVMISAAASTLAMALPIIAIATVIGLLGVAFKLVYDDIMNFINGNDSMIGRILEKYPVLKSVIMTIWQAWQSFFEYLKEAVTVVADFVIAAWDLISNSFNQFIQTLEIGINNLIAWGQSIIDIFIFVSDSVVSLFEWMWGCVEKILDFVDEKINLIQDIWQSAKSFFGMDDEEKEIRVVQKVERRLTNEGELDYILPQSQTATRYYSPMQEVKSLNNGLAISSNNSLNPMTSQMISNQSSIKNESNVQIGEIKIETQATNGAEVVKEIKKSYTEQEAKNISQNHSSGWRV